MKVVGASDISAITCSFSRVSVYAAPRDCPAAGRFAGKGAQRIDPVVAMAAIAAVPAYVSLGYSYYVFRRQLIEQERRNERERNLYIKHQQQEPDINHTLL